jgi:GMP synthase (glutamine-hydrolysing)
MTGAPLRFLVAESEPPEAREHRRHSVGQSSGESYIATLRSIAPQAHCTRIKPADADVDLPGIDAIAAFDAVFITGSPLHLYEESPEATREIAFMRAVFAAGTPSFGSCAGLQVATVAAGGRVRSMPRRTEAGFARRITATAAGRDHPLLAGRPAAFDAPAVHSDEVEALPDGASLLASNAVTHVQAAEIRFDRGVFWGVQYHPELDLIEIAAALRRQADDLIEQALARSPDDVEAQAALVEQLGRDPGRADLAWRLGLDAQVADADGRTTELRNFIAHLGTLRAAGRG